jgi:hypothetical protein
VEQIAYSATMRIWKEIYRVITNDLSVSKTYSTKTKRDTEIKLTPFEGYNRKIVIACGRRDVTPMMFTRSPSIGKGVKWCLNSRKRT